MSFTLPNPEKNDFASGQILSFSHLNNNANNVIAMANYIGSANTVTLSQSGTVNLPTSTAWTTIPSWTTAKTIGASGVIQVNSDGFTVLAAGTYIIFAFVGCIIPTGSVTTIRVAVDGIILGLPSSKTEQVGNLGNTTVNHYVIDDVPANTRFKIMVANDTGGSGRSVSNSYFTIFRLK